MIRQYFSGISKLVSRSLGHLDVVKVEPFLCFGNAETIFIKGRVINAYKQSRPKSSNHFLKNIYASFRRYAVTSVANASVKIIYNGCDLHTQTNDEGVFEAHIGAKIPSNGKEEVVYFSVTPKNEGEKAIVEKKVVQRILSDQDVGIVSDIDDTIIVSHATSVGKKFWLSISKNAYTRRPFSGVSDLYKEVKQTENAAVFYVSSSDWSLFDLIQDFLRYREIPLGPILLKDQHINIKNIWKSGGGDHYHKLDKICFLFDMFPQMKFYLIGDSGQKDPEIYAKVVEKYPNRVLGIIIRVIKELELKRKSQLVNRLDCLKIAFVKDSDEALQYYRQLNSRIYENQ
jgi:phosphatidate phosphatase APP1